MRLTVRLDQETERCLRELLDETGQDKSSLIRQLIHWRGGHPASFLATLPPGSAERAQRRERLDGLLKARRRQRP